MTRSSSAFKVTLLDEPTYSAGSADNVRRYEREYCLAMEHRASSKHGLICQSAGGALHSCILLAGGGATGVHSHSSIIVNDACFVAVGDMLCALSLPTLDLEWATKVDAATCFGVYYSDEHECLLSHGELEICRLTLSGEVVWSTGGKDIFSEGIRVTRDYVEAIDFNQNLYWIDIVSGRSELISNL